MNAHNTFYQTKYFREFTQLQENAFYFQFYIIRDNKIEYCKNIILAITSSGAIGAWAIWQTYPMVWGCIIALCQIIQAVSPILPYKKRVEMLNKVSSEFDGLCIRAESDWYEIANGRKTDDEIHEMQMKLKGKIKNIMESNLKGNVIPIKDELSEKALRKREIYFANQFPEKG
jgi:hypothetical protein